MEHNTTVRKSKSSSTKVDGKINFIDKKVNKLRRKKSSKTAMLVVDFYDFYKKEIYKKHIILYVISLILFFIMLVYAFKFNNTGEEFSNLIKDISNGSEILGKRANFRSIFFDKVLLNFILLFSGITPYVYIPVLGIIYPCTLVTNILNACNNLAMNMNPTFLTIGSIIQLIGISLTSATGIYYCKLSTKRFRYTQMANFTLNDLKKEYYSIKKDEEKLDEVIKKEEKRNKKIDELNVKIPYKYLLISFVISSIIIIFGGIIALI